MNKYKQKVSNLLIMKYGIGIGDCTDEEAIEVAFNTGETVEEFVDGIADKYSLSPLESFTNIKFL